MTYIQHVCSKFSNYAKDDIIVALEIFDSLIAIHKNSSEQNQKEISRLADYIYSTVKFQTRT